MVPVMMMVIGVIGVEVAMAMVVTVVMMVIVTVVMVVVPMAVPCCSRRTWVAGLTIALTQSLQTTQATFSSPE